MAAYTNERMNGDTDQRPSYFDRLSMSASPRVRSFARWYDAALDNLVAAMTDVWARLHMRKAA